MSGAVGSVEWMLTEGQSQKPAALGQPIDTRTFQQYDRNNATARQQVLNARDSLAPIFRPVDRTALQDVLQGNAPLPTDAEQRQTVQAAMGVIPLAGVTLYHGTDINGLNGIRKTGYIEPGSGGKVFMTPSEEMAGNYAEHVIRADVPTDKLQIDLDLPGQRTLNIDEANRYLGNEGWDISDYLGNNYSVAVAGSVPIKRGLLSP